VCGDEIDDGLCTDGHRDDELRHASMRVAVTGATGMIGAAAVDALLARGHTVAALTRDVDRARARMDERVELHAWSDPKHEPPPPAAIARADAVLHLAGEPIAQRWSAEAKREIDESRVLVTSSLVAGLAALAPELRPRALVSQSASGYYGPCGAEPIDESHAPGSDFPAEVSARWEAAASTCVDGVRVALTRTGVVLSPRGGALAKMLPPFRLGLGGPVAGGRQYVPWVHLDDVVEALLHCFQDERASGPINVTAPNPVRNAELARTLGRVLNRPALLPVPGVALRLLYGEMATIVLTGQRAMPTRLQELGYRFRFRELEPALRDVLDGR
jgi:uncharacterized protein (TIGR01777 family)